MHFCWQKSNVRFANAMFIACLCALVVSYPRVAGWLKFQVGFTSVPTDYPRVWELSAYPLLVSSLLWLSITAPLAKVIFGSTPTRHLGNISYSMYLLHMPVFHVLSTLRCLTDNRAVFFACFLAAIIAVSTASRRWIEQPFERIIRRSDASRNSRF